MRRSLFAGTAAFLIVVIVSWWAQRSTPASLDPAAAPSRPGSTAPASSPAATAPRSPLADALGAPETPAEHEPAIVLAVCGAYRRQLRGFPSGEDNREFTRRLTGANPARLAFVPPDHPRINARSELVDAWGTPFFFHLISRDQLDVRSAGPDRTLYTDDDLVAATPLPSRAGNPPAPAPRR